MLVIFATSFWLKIDLFFIFFAAGLKVNSQGRETFHFFVYLFLPLASACCKISLCIKTCLTIVVENTTADSEFFLQCLPIDIIIIHSPEQIIDLFDQIEEESCDKFVRHFSITSEGVARRYKIDCNKLPNFCLKLMIRYLLSSIKTVILCNLNIFRLFGISLWINSINYDTQPQQKSTSSGQHVKRCLPIVPSSSIKHIKLSTGNWSPETIDREIEIRRTKDCAEWRGNR